MSWHKNVNKRVSLSFIFLQCFVMKHWEMLAVKHLQRMFWLEGEVGWCDVEAGGARGASGHTLPADGESEVKYTNCPSSTVPSWCHADFHTSWKSCIHFPYTLHLCPSMLSCIPPFCPPQLALLQTTDWIQQSLQLQAWNHACIHMHFLMYWFSQ